MGKEKQVRVEGLEPPHLTAPDPKSGVSTNFTTPACLRTYLFYKVPQMYRYSLNSQNELVKLS